jgi:hypothetical protein
MKRLRSLVFAALVLGTLVVPATALGADPSSDGNTAGVAQGLLSSQGGDDLPFTGLNLALIVIGGVVLLGTGILLRRRSSSNES